MRFIMWLILMMSVVACASSSSKGVNTGTPPPARGGESEGEALSSLERSGGGAPEAPPPKVKKFELVSDRDALTRAKECRAKVNVDDKNSILAGMDCVNDTTIGVTEATAHEIGIIHQELEELYDMLVMFEVYAMGKAHFSDAASSGAMPALELGGRIGKRNFRLDGVFGVGWLNTWYMEVGVGPSLRFELNDALKLVLHLHGKGGWYDGRLSVDGVAAKTLGLDAGLQLLIALGSPAQNPPRLMLGISYGPALCWKVGDTPGSTGVCHSGNAGLGIEFF